MRISDWSSDVCSSDLMTRSRGRPRLSTSLVDALQRQVRCRDARRVLQPAERECDLQHVGVARLERVPAGDVGDPEQADRKSAVKGKRVAGRVDSGGHSIITKKKNRDTISRRNE